MAFKNILKTIIILSSLIVMPVSAHAQFASGWSASSTDQGWIYPDAINGANPTIYVDRLITSSTTATSTIRYGLNVLGGCIALNGTCITSGTSTQFPTSTNPLMGTYFVATSTTATSTLPNLSVSSALSIFGNYVNSLTGLKSLINYWTLSGSNLNYTAGNVGIGTTTPGTTLGVQGKAVIADNVVSSSFTATSTTATSSLPQISSSVISSLWGSFTRLFVSGLSSDVGKYVVVGTNGELVATTTPQLTTIINISGSINDTNTTFTAASEPLLLVINGVTYASTGGAYTWTYSGGIITLSQPVGTNGSIFGISLGTGLVSMVADPYVFYVPVISGDPTAVLQTYINTAAALATSTDKIATLKFPTTEYQTDRLIVQENTTWDCTNTVFSKRSDAVGQVNASIIQAIRYTVGGQYYGHNDNITLKGCTFKSNDKTITQALVMLLDVRNLVMEDLDFVHSPAGLQLATNFCGRGIRGNNLRIRGGTTTFQDGFHITCGDGMTFTNLICEQSGDDCLALGRDIAGPSNIGEDEGISNVTVNGLVCNSIKGRCATFYAGHDFIDSGFANVRKIKNVIVNGAVGNCGQIRSFCLGVMDEMDYGQIFSYTINSGGSGYTSGTYLAQATTGGGCTTQPTADVTITAGVITRVIPSGSGAGIGNGCTSGPTLSLTGLGAGVGASVTGDMVVIDTSLVSNISFQGKLTQGTTTGTHDNNQSYGMYITTGNNVKIDVDMTFLSPTIDTFNWNIYCGDNYDVRWRQTGTTTRGGWVYPSTWNCSTSNWKWHDGLFQAFDGVTNPGEGVFYFRGGGNSNWSITNNTFQNMSTNSVGIAYNAGTTSSLQIIGNTAYKATGATGTRFMHQQSCINCSTNLVMEHNDVSTIDIPINGSTGFQASNVSYRIRDNIGIKTNYCANTSISSAATSTNVTVGTLTGLTTAGVLGTGHIKAYFTGGTIYATTSPTINITSTTTYAVGVQSPVSSTQPLIVCEDTSIKPLN